MLCSKENNIVERIQNYYIVGFSISAAIMAMLLENEAMIIKILCLILLLGNFVFASLFHHYINKSANTAHKHTVEK